MPIDPDPQPTCTNPQRLVIPPRTRVSNAHWDAQRMRDQAQLSAYPSADGAGRAGEVAYWRQRLVWDGEAETEAEPT